MKKFEQVIPLSDFEVMTPFGWKDATKLIQTEEFQEYELKTDKGSTLYCADKHNIIMEDGNEHFVDELFVGMRLKTKSGVEIVTSVKPTNRRTKMYDLEVPDGHQYYTNDIASHNTTTTMAYLLHQAITRSNITIAILANKGDTAAEVLDRIKFAYESLPWYLQVGVKTWNKKSIELGNGSKIITAATSGSSIRGKSVNCIYIDEIAHIDNDVEFYTSTYPVISSGKSTQVIMTSTPKGLNLFYKIWCDAIEGRNKFKTLAYDWTVVPGRDEAWREETIANTSPVQFAQEFECVSGDTIVTVRHPVSNQIYEISIERLHEIQNGPNGVVYMIERSDGIKYIGITVDFDKRLKAHRKSVRFSSGIKSFCILFSGKYGECELLEKYFISKYDTFKNGLNVTIDGKGLNGECKFNTLGFIYREESRQKMRDSAIRRYQNELANGITRKVPKHSAEQRKKWSILRKGVRPKHSILSVEEMNNIKSEYKSWFNDVVQNKKYRIYWKYCKLSLQEKCKLGEIHKFSDIISPSGNPVKPRRIFAEEYFSKNHCKVKIERVIQFLKEVEVNDAI